MSLMLGIVAASGGVADDYVWIATQEVTGSSVDTITFSNIPSTYRALELRTSIRQTTALSSFPIELYMKFNNDSGSNYSTHAMNSSSNTFYTNGTSAGSGNKFRVGFTTNGSSTSGTQSAALIHIAGYSNPLTMTSFRALYGSPAETRLGQTTGQWSSTATVDSVSLTGSYSFDVGSVVSLYGYKV